MYFEIDRERAINVLIKERDEYKARYLYDKHLEPYYKYLCEIQFNALDYAIKELKKQINVQPEPKTGRWENDKDCIPRCSCCSYIPEYNSHIDDYYYSDFCPNCGARMEK